MRARGQPSRPENLAGSLLLAHPAMRDPNFRRAVVLMSAHNAEGAMGVVLNRPLDKNLGILNGAFALGPLASVPVFQGGPVQTEQLILVAWQMRPDGFRLFFGIEPDKATQLAGEEDTHLRAFLGYAGWTAGQLDNEMARQDWLTHPASVDLIFDTDPAALWKSILRQKDYKSRLLADSPEDLSWN